VPPPTQVLGHHYISIERGFVNHAIPAFRLRSNAENPHDFIAFVPNPIAADPAKLALSGALASRKIRNS
jgi:hypothetical protein